MTNSEAVSKIINSIRALNKDEHISRRYVLRLLRDRAKNLISQKLLDRTIFYETDLYTDIECFEFEKVEVIKCPIIEFRMCKTLMKSKKPLPKLIFSRLGASIKEITSVDGFTDLIRIEPRQYRINQKRSTKIESDIYVYLGADNYLYIPDQAIYSVNLKVLTMDTDEADECSECKDKGCESAWESKFPCPDKLEDIVFKETLQIVSSTFRGIVPDQNPNGIERQ